MKRSKITESVIEKLAIELLEKQGYQYIYAPSIASANMKSNNNQIRTLEKLRDTLLPKLMSGEVRIKKQMLGQPLWLP